MQKIDLPHEEPIRFAKHIIYSDANQATVQVEFSHIPSLAMLIEASAQSSSALSESNVKKGYLVSFKNIELLHPPTKNSLEVEATHQNTLANMKLISFRVFENQMKIATGSLVIAIDAS